MTASKILGDNMPCKDCDQCRAYIKTIEREMCEGLLQELKDTDATVFNLEARKLVWTKVEAYFGQNNEGAK